MKISVLGKGLLVWSAGIAAALTLTASAAPPPKVVVSADSIDRTASLPASFAPIVKKVAPCVVNIFSSRSVKVPAHRHSDDDPLLQHLFGYDGNQDDHPRARTRKMESLGSGVIISADGYILTNNHVVDGADDIKVALANDKGEYTARVVGSDPQTDIAVLKIEAKDLKSITLADSDKVEVGDVVLAIGNPFGVGQSVTKGIVSAMGRDGFGITDYEDFIQTDAAINPGNSGGALIDINGRLIGINQSIVSWSGANQGVGFAVPVNLTRSIMDSLVTEGVVKHGYLGVMIQQITPDLATEFNLPTRQGALVGQIQPNTPAAAAGLKEGDVITEINGKSMSDSLHVKLAIAHTAPQTKVALTIIREGKEQKVSATLATLPEDPVASSDEGDNQVAPARTSALDGVDISDLDPHARRQYGVPTTLQGALVTDVDSASSAAEAGLHPGDVIVSVDRQPAPGATAVADLIQKATGTRILLRVWSKQGGFSSVHYVVIEAGNKK